MADILRECPFCGGEMTVSGSSRLRRFTISHKNLRNCYFYSFEIDWQTVGSLEEAIKAWNKRDTTENMRHYKQGLADAVAKAKGELMQTFNPD